MRLFRHLLLVLISTCFLNQAIASEKPLAPDQAFAFSATMKDEQTIIARWKVAKDHYLYRNRIHFALEQKNQGQLSPPILPTGTPKQDEVFGKYQIYSDTVQIAIPVMVAEGKREISLLASFQGCSASGYCYPPTTRKVTLNTHTQLGRYTDGIAVSTSQQAQAAFTSKHDEISDLLATKRYFTIMLTFLGLGLLLSFTPCVLPMIPILSSIIVGHKQPMHMAKAFRLSLVYVLTMSFTYAIAGIFVGYIGSSVQALFQQAWILIMSSVIFVALALSFFGFYEIQLPQALQNKLTMMSNRQQGGTYLGVIIMGCLATLIVSPCVTPALVGALGYIAKSGDALLGGAALFTLGFGMGIPLLVIGTAGGKLLPKAGGWMDSVKDVFGVILLGMAVWILGRVIPGQVQMMLYAGLLIISSTYLGVFNGVAESNWKKLFKGFGTLMLVYGTTLVIGATMGNDNPLSPLGHIHYAQAKSSSKLHFAHVKSIADVDNSIARYENTKKLVMLDFYADWCVSCKDMQRNTFTDPMVKSLLSHFTLLKADITHNDQVDRDLQHHFDVVAPPVLVFFKANGEELTSFRLVGEIGTHELVAHLQKMLSES